MGAMFVMALFFGLLFFLNLGYKIWAHNREYTWRRVVFQSELDMWGNCPLCARPFDTCPCPGPGQWNLQYRSNNNGILEARSIAEQPEVDMDPYEP
jgi:hypothetical protein